MTNNKRMIKQRQISDITSFHGYYMLLEISKVTTTIYLIKSKRNQVSVNPFS